MLIFFLDIRLGTFAKVHTEWVNHIEGRKLAFRSTFFFKHLLLQGPLRL